MAVSTFKGAAEGTQKVQHVITDQATRETLERMLEAAKNGHFGKAYDEAKNLGPSVAVSDVAEARDVLGQVASLFSEKLFAKANLPKPTLTPFKPGQH